MPKQNEAEKQAKAEAEEIRQSEDYEIKPVQTTEGELASVIPQGNYKLSDHEKRVAVIIAQNDLNHVRNRKSISEIAELAGYSERGLYHLRAKAEFQRFRGDIVTLSLNDAQTQATARLLEMVNGTHTGTPSMKAIELLFKLTGRLSDKQELTIRNGGDAEDLKTADIEDIDDIIGHYDSSEEDDETEAKDLF